jgi:hypothetical protein
MELKMMPIESDDNTIRRLSILKGISHGSNAPAIALELGIATSVVKHEIQVMRYLRDEGLKEAEKVAFELPVNKPRTAAIAGSKRFLEMTGLTFQEKTFRNMVEFYKPELLGVIRAANQYEALMRLPKSVLKTLRNNEIINHERKNLVITAKARSQLE